MTTNHPNRGRSDVKATLAALDRAAMTLASPDARRVMRETANNLRARTQRASRGEADLASAVADAKHVLAMWEGY